MGLVLKPVTISETKKILKNIKNSNARGNCELTNRIVKAIPEYMAVAIIHLANRIFTTGVYPTSLKITRILPLRKMGKPEDDFGSYRPINNLNPISKIIEEMIRVRIDEHLVTQKILPDNSHGCRSGYSTLTAMMNIEKHVKTNKSKGETSVLQATDLTAAFDTIDHVILMQKMEHIGIRGKPLSV